MEGKEGIQARVGKAVRKVDQAQEYLTAVMGILERNMGFLG
jgi:hypothetical protein